MGNAGRHGNHPQMWILANKFDASRTGAAENVGKSAVPLTEKHLARIYSGSMAATEAAFLVFSDVSLHRVG